MEDLVAAHEALMRKMSGKDDDPGDGGNPPTGAAQDTSVKPGTSNVVHEPNPDGVYAKQDRRSVTTTHHITRKAKGVPVQKNVAPGRLVNAGGIDLATLFTGLKLNPA